MTIVATVLATAGQAVALPGQNVSEVEAWVRAHPTLRPAVGERLRVHRTDTPAQRFTFEASQLPPGRMIEPLQMGEIRSEKIELYDMINGVNRDRLAESLRVIYGQDIYQDFNRAQEIYVYPNPLAVAQARNQNAPLLAALEGELRLGDRYAYWIEVVSNPSGEQHSGRITVLKPQDLDALEIQLRNR
jgi:hypothetical protein